MSRVVSSLFSPPDCPFLKVPPVRSSRCVSFLLTLASSALTDPRSLDAAQAVDVEMMQSLNATERTPAMLDALLKQAGLKRVGLYNPRSPHGIVEAMLA